MLTECYTVPQEMTVKQIALVALILPQMPGDNVVNILSFMKQYSTDSIFPILYLFVIETKGRNALCTFIFSCSMTSLPYKAFTHFHKNVSYKSL